MNWYWEKIAGAHNTYHGHDKPHLHSDPVNTTYIDMSRMSIILFSKITSPKELPIMTADAAAALLF